MARDGKVGGGDKGCSSVAEVTDDRGKRRGGSWKQAGDTVPPPLQESRRSRAELHVKSFKQGLDGAWAARTCTAVLMALNQPLLPAASPPPTEAARSVSPRSKAEAAGLRSNLSQSSESVRGDVPDAGVGRASGGRESAGTHAHDELEAPPPREKKCLAADDREVGEAHCRRMRNIQTETEGGQ
jgi:hypothetical protein